MNHEQHQRYSRQILLQEFGEEAQHKLLAARVLVVGAGGLGSPALQYLAAAGVGTIGIVDNDVVDISNLQRQVLFTGNDIGKYKTTVARTRIVAQNPDCICIEHTVRIDNTNALDIIKDYDVVLDGTDNFSTRYMINDACVLLNKPLVFGAVLRFEGQVAVFNLADAQGIKTNYRDWFPLPPQPTEVVSCSEAGVLGVVPGIIGTMQATEVLKIITGIGTPLHNTVLTYNALHNTFYQFGVRANPNTQYPATPQEFMAFNYNWFCNIAQDIPTVRADEFTQMLLQGNLLVIDVREPNEQPRVTEFASINIPLRSLQTSVPTLTAQQTVVVFCQTGKRSAAAVQLLQQQFPTVSVLSLQGGIQQWLHNNKQV